MIHNVDLAHPLTDHPIWEDVAGVWLPCGNTAGGDRLIDLGPYGNHGQLMNGPKWIGTERGVGLDMPYGQCIALGNPPALNIGTQPFSIVVTLLPFLGYPGHRAMAGKSFSSWGSTGWVLQRYNDGESRFIIGNNGYYQVLYDSYPGNQHIQIAATRDGQTQHLFHDASEHVYGYADPRIAGDLTNSQDFYLGQVPGWGYVQSLFASAFLLTRPVKATEVAFFYEQSLRDYPDLIRTEPTRSWFLPLAVGFNDAPGITYTAQVTRPHYAAKPTRPHYAAKPTRPHYHA